MANGVYGQTIPSQITSSDVDIFYSYSESRSSDSAELTVFKRLPSTLLRTQTRQLEEGSDSVLEGMYKINLPLNEFNKKGFFNSLTGSYNRFYEGTLWIPLDVNYHASTTSKKTVGEARSLEEAQQARDVRANWKPAHQIQLWKEGKMIYS